MSTRADCIAWESHQVLNADHFTWDCPTLSIDAATMWLRHGRPDPRWSS